MCQSKERSIDKFLCQRREKLLRKCHVSKCNECNICQSVWCNELEEWLIKTNCNPTVVRKQILKARAFLRGTLLDKVKEVRNNDGLVLTLTYHPSIKNFQNILNEAHILLTPN